MRHTLISGSANVCTIFCAFSISFVYRVEDKVQSEHIFSGVAIPLLLTLFNKLRVNLSLPTFDLCRHIAPFLSHYSSLLFYLSVKAIEIFSQMSIILSS